MNQKQRDYLTDKIKKTASSQIDELRAKMPIKPSLNNYLIAAFLDGTIEFADLELLKTNMRERVINMGVNDTLVSDERDVFGSRSRYSESKHPYVKILATELFVTPKAYTEALERYEKAKKEIDDQINLIRAQANTAETKIQIGSSTALESLIQQADDLTNLKLVNDQLKLTQ